MLSDMEEISLLLMRNSCKLTHTVRLGICFKLFLERLSLVRQFKEKSLLVGKTVK